MLKIHAYGDESCGITAVSYGVLIVPRPLVPKLEHRLSLTKIAFGGRAWDDLHCNQLMNEADRARGPWSHLRYEDIFSFFDRICSDLLELQTQQTVCLFERTQTATLEQAFAQPWTDAEGNEVERTLAESIQPGDKFIALLCGLSLLRAVLDGVGPVPLTFIPDPDGDTKILWGSEIRRVEELLAQGTYDTRGKFRYLAAKRPKPTLLQIADLVAYVAQRACRDTATETTRRFKALADRLITATHYVRP